MNAATNDEKTEKSPKEFTKQNSKTTTYTSITKNIPDIKVSQTLNRNNFLEIKKFSL